MDPTPKKYLTVKEAAELLSLTPGALRVRIHRGQIPVHRIAGSRSIRLREDEVLASTPRKEVQA